MTDSAESHPFEPMVGRVHRCAICDRDMTVHPEASAAACPHAQGFPCVESMTGIHYCPDCGADEPDTPPTSAAPISQETRRHWLNAYILEDWRRRVGPALRKSYKANEDALTRSTYAEVRVALVGWIASIDSVLEGNRAE